MMSQHEINQSEWKNPANWGGPKLISVYFSKRDSRTWVPKQIPWTGWTVNLAKTAGVLWYFGIVLGAMLLVIGSAIYTIGYR